MKNLISKLKGKITCNVYVASDGWVLIVVPNYSRDYKKLSKLIDLSDISVTSASELSDDMIEDMVEIIIN